MFDNKKYCKKYYQEHKKHILILSKKYYKDHKKHINESSKKYRIEHKEDIAKYRSEHREERNKYMKKRRKELRIKLLNIISNGNICCVKCGCDDIRLLEINHKNGRGNKELQKGKKSLKFYDDILKGKRKTDDLELLCRICNNLHYLELKFGKLPYKISYKKEGYIL